MGKQCAKQHALVVEDNSGIVYGVRPILEKQHLQIEHVKTYEAAIQKLQQKQYELLIVDRILPDGDGVELVRELESYAAGSRVLMISTKGEVKDKVEGLYKGADDYLPKPFSGDELAARVHALLRRNPTQSQSELTLGKVRIQVNEHQLCYQEKTVRLSGKVWSLFSLFMQQSHAFVTREMIATHLWSLEDMPTQSAIDAIVSRLRRKISPLNISISSKYGYGYELVFTE